MKLKLLLLLILFAKSYLVYANPEASIEIATRSLQYHEQLDDKIFVNEKGKAHQATIQYRKFLSPSWHLNVQSQITYGTLDYEGQTLLGTPLITETDYRLGNIALQIQYAHSTQFFTVFPYLKISPHYWSRKVLPTEHTAAVRISRRWWEMDAGIILHKPLINHWSIQFETYWGISAGEKVMFDYTSSGFAKKSADSNQGNFWGAGICVAKQFQSPWRLTTGYRLHHAHWGKSDTVIFGHPTMLSLFEPRNRLKNAEIFIGLSTRIQ